MTKILIACEESQRVTIEFRKLGFEAYSCDVIECSGGHPEWHLQQDVIELLKQHWDAVIAFPPCTYLTVTGNKYFNIDRYGDRARQRHIDREKAKTFFMQFTRLDCPWAIENPIGVMSTAYRKPDQIVQPYWFGDEASKKTCLWLNQLPQLVSTDMVNGGERVKMPNGKTMAKWYNAGGRDRQKNRSKTFPGLARAMATQWGEAIKEQSND
jgi:hypothetical protein